jgi:hypothetical protein
LVGAAIYTAAISKQRIASFERPLILLGGRQRFTVLRRIDGRMFSFVSRALTMCI